MARKFKKTKKVRGFKHREQARKTRSKAELMDKVKAWLRLKGIKSSQANIHQYWAEALRSLSWLK